MTLIALPKDPKFPFEESSDLGPQWSVSAFPVLLPSLLSQDSARQGLYVLRPVEI